MPAKGQTVIQLFEELAPKWLALPDDAIGLQIGTLHKSVQKVLVALDVTMEVVEEAIALEVDLIISHHALIFRPLKNLQTDRPLGKIYEKCLKHDIAVYTAHTNLDIAQGGVNDMLAKAIQLQPTDCLAKVHEEKLYKFVCYVPQKQKEAVMHACFAAGAGHIGDYSHCSFQLEGVGTFKPGSGTDPYIGKQGQVEHVDEARLETVVPERLLKKVVQAMKQAHPYEEAAYDIFPLALPGKTYGLGRIGKLDRPITLGALAEQVKTAYHASFARIVGDIDRKVSKVAVLGGAGSKYIHQALFKGADVLITGDIDYHTAHDALAAGLCLIDPGHHIEHLMKQGVTDYLRAVLDKNHYKTEVLASKYSTEPFQIV